MLVICGLKREAMLAGGPDILAIPGGGARQVLEGRLAAVPAHDIAAVVSFGLAGALDPHLAAGDIAIPSALILPASDGGAMPAPISRHLTMAWTEAAARQGLRIASHDPIAAVDRPLTTPADKAGCRAATGAAAVDMESHVAAAYAARLGVPFGILRVVSDGADRTVPPAAIAAIGACGGLDVPAVLASLAREPRQIPALIGTARDGARAFRVLRRVGRLLGGSLGAHLR